MKPTLFKILFALVSLNSLTGSASAQNWVSGYSYRKKVSINKNKVTATTVIYGNGVTENKDLINFPVLIELNSDDLRHIPRACGNKMQNPEGKDISFTLTDSTTPLDFQLESYDASTGKLTCWVKIPSLSAQGTPTPATLLYFYYGSAILHNPRDSKNTGIWSADYSRVWHMNLDVTPATTKNARTNVAQEGLKGVVGMDASNYIESKVGTGIKLDGGTESINSATENSTAVTVSAWVKLNTIGREQMLVTNDSSRTVGALTISDGYKLMVNASGQPIFELYRSTSTPFTIQVASTLVANTWYYICAQSTGLDASIFINGIKAGGRLGNSAQRLGPGGSVKIGSSKYNSSHLSGELDEIRIQSNVRPTEWMKTEYTNQISPQEFYTVAAEEYNPSGFSRFTGGVNSSWNLPANWSSNSVPSTPSNIIVSTGKTLEIASTSSQSFNKLILETGAVLIVNNTVEVSCYTTLSKNAEIKIQNNGILKFNGDVINNGMINSGQTNGKMIFASQTEIQQFEGTGIARVSCIEINQAQGDIVTKLLAPIEVYDQVIITKGILSASGMLTLLSTQSATAMIAPILSSESQLIGDIQVQQYITGDFPTPATARGWRLLSSPVYSSQTGDTKNYNVSAYKKALFLTGPGGSSNGFDPSAQNGSTIYTHEQSLPGNLSQKYVPITNAAATIETGKGIYLFSRGSRNAPNAYSTQVEKAPFSNPSGYIITHTGKAFIGELSVPAYNKNNNEEGSGFNLLGNPYASALTWGKLHKTNLSSFIWMFDPLNNSYYVSDDASTLIPSGAGFFVRINTGSTTGVLTFTEQSKYNGSSSSLMKFGYQSSEAGSVKQSGKSQQLVVGIEKDSFKQEYRLLFTPAGNDGVGDEDAVKLGEGYVSIAGLQNGIKLSVDQRGTLKSNKEVKLYVKGWTKGEYALVIQGTDSFRDVNVTLVDRYANKREALSTQNEKYSFQIDVDDPTSYGSERFSILFEQKENIGISSKFPSILYPNPFSEKFHIKTRNTITTDATVIIRNYLGKLVLRQHITTHEGDIEIITSHLPAGIYIVQILAENSARTVASFKVVKE